MLQSQIKNEPIDPLVNYDEIKFEYFSETGRVKDETISSVPIDQKCDDDIKTETYSNYKCDKCHRIYKQFHYFKMHKKKCTGSNQRKTIPKRPSRIKLNSKNKNAQSPEILPMDTLQNQINIPYEHPIEMTENAVQKRLKCEFCTESFTSLSAFDYHLLNHNVQLQFNSQTTDQVPADDNKNHTQKQENIKKEPIPWPCSDCGQAFCNVAQLKSHKRIHKRRDLFSCDLCDRQYKRAVDLEIHKTKIHQWAVPRICKCGQQFTSENVFARHECFAISFECFLCHEIKKTLRKLKRHLFHHRVQGGVCDVCGKCFRDRRYLKSHMDNVHSDDLNCNFECDICKKRFQSREKIRNHMKFHRPDRPFACDVCGKKFLHRSHVRAHAVIHSEIRKHECHLCRRTYRRKWDLTKHMNSHYKTKIFACRLCSKSYLQRTRVNRHLNINHQIFKEYSLYINAIKN